MLCKLFPWLADVSTHEKPDICVSGNRRGRARAVCCAPTIPHKTTPIKNFSPSVKQPASKDKFDDEYPWWGNTLSGDWRGWRDDVAARGIVFDIHYVSLPVNNVHGRFDIEFFADNSGRWFFHCHNMYHMLAGMARVVEYVV